MSIKKQGHPVKIDLVKSSAFSFDPNLIAKKFQQAMPKKQITMDELHSGIKALGIDNYSSEDLNGLINILKSIGFKILN